MAQIKDLKRMCAAQGESCHECPLRGDCATPDGFLDNADEIVDKWVKEHPVKTYAMDFFEKFPNARRGNDGVPKPCVREMYGNLDIDCSNIYCADCWNQEMKGE